MGIFNPMHSEAEEIKTKVKELDTINVGGQIMSYGEYDHLAADVPEEDAR